MPVIFVKGLLQAWSSLEITCYLVIGEQISLWRCLHFSERLDVQRPRTNMSSGPRLQCLGASSTIDIYSSGGSQCSVSQVSDLELGHIQ